jgi:hypothetical protein
MAKMTFKQRLQAARAKHGKRARSALAFGGGTVATVGMDVGVGAAAQAIGQLASSKIGFVRNNWYGEPLALAAAGFLLLRRKPALAHATLGAAGYSGMFRYKLDAFQKGKSQTTPVPTFTGGAAPTNAGLLQDAGAIDANTF